MREVRGGAEICKIVIVGVILSILVLPFHWHHYTVGTAVLSEIQSHD